jgi:chorismate synthase
VNNTFGKILQISIYGASHDEAIGIVIEGAPEGIHLPAKLFDDDLNRRRPQLSGETSRHESDTPHISGLDKDERTTTEPIRIEFLNGDTRSKDYSHLRRQPRPSHADLVQMRKYGPEYNIAGGGIASGRMTVALVAAGVVAKRILSEATFHTEVISIGGERDPERQRELIRSVTHEGDSVGGVVECRVTGLPHSLGEPFFDSTESIIAHLLFSIPGVKGVEFGDGFAGSEKRGSERNDAIISAQGHTLTNNEGGINGGITNGNELIVRVAIKPTPSIARKQHTYNFDSEAIEELTIGGRHDSCIARRAAVVVEAMVALALADLKLQV